MIPTTTEADLNFSICFISLDQHLPARLSDDVTYEIKEVFPSFCESCDENIALDYLNEKIDDFKDVFHACRNFVFFTSSILM